MDELPRTVLQGMSASVKVFFTLDAVRCGAKRRLAERNGTASGVKLRRECRLRECVGVGLALGTRPRRRLSRLVHAARRGRVWTRCQGNPHHSRLSSRHRDHGRRRQDAQRLRSFLSAVARDGSSCS